MIQKAQLKALPGSWSDLTWQQLCDCWHAKMLYGGQSDAARVAALLSLCGLTVLRDRTVLDSRTGETMYMLKDESEQLWTAAPRELSYMASQALPWFDFPYGDPGEPEQKDEKGKVVKERREPHVGYVGPMRDALELPMETIKVGRTMFALPQAALSNLTWQQYRSMQEIAPQLFAEENDEATVLQLQAQFMAYAMIPRSMAILDSSGKSAKLRLHHVYEYDAERADELTRFWEGRLSKKNSRDRILFYIVFQCYQTAVGYYSQAYPLLFSSGGKQDAMRDALQGEVGTINTIMKYAGYAEQQQVYDSNIPFVLDILNTMTKEAKEIERMNSKIKKK
jgi:hypothetical protein